MRRYAVTCYFDVPHGGWDDTIVRDIYIPDNASDRDILSALVREGYLKSTLGVQVIDVFPGCCPGCLEIVRRDGVLLYGLDEL